MMFVYIVKEVDYPGDSEKIAGVFLDPLNAEAYRIQFGYSHIEKHEVADSEQIKDRLKSVNRAKGSQNNVQSRSSNPPPT